jgi:RNA polymerase sigma factor (sigma-70 family)
MVSDAFGCLTTNWEPDARIAAIPIVSSDSEIMRRSGANPAAFSELYQRHAVAIHRYAARRSDSHVADDVMSETFLVAFERRAEFDGSRDDARPWLYGIATTLLKKHSRVEARAWKGMRAGSLGEVSIDAIEAVGSKVDAERETRMMAAAIKRMPAGYRDALLLHAWADLDYDGIAQALGVPIGTVRSRLNRARQMLRAAGEAGSARNMEVNDGRTDPAARNA